MDIKEMSQAFAFPYKDFARMQDCVRAKRYYEASKMGLDICDYITRFTVLILIDGVMQYVLSQDAAKIQTAKERLQYLLNMSTLRILVGKQKLSSGDWEQIVNGFISKISHNEIKEEARAMWGEENGIKEEDIPRSISFDWLKFGNESSADDLYKFFYDRAKHVRNILYGKINGDDLGVLKESDIVSIMPAVPGRGQLLSSIRNDSLGHGVYGFNEDVIRSNYEAIAVRVVLLMHVLDEYKKKVIVVGTEDSIRIQDAEGECIVLRLADAKSDNPADQIVSCLFDSHDRIGNYERNIRVRNFVTGKKDSRNHLIPNFDKLYKKMARANFNYSLVYGDRVTVDDRKLYDTFQRDLMYNYPIANFIRGKIEKADTSEGHHVFALFSDKSIGKTVFARSYNRKSQTTMKLGHELDDFNVITVVFGEGSQFTDYGVFLDEIATQFNRKDDRVTCYVDQFKTLKESENAALNALKEDRVTSIRAFIQKCREIDARNKPVLFIFDGLDYFFNAPEKSEVPLLDWLDAVKGMDDVYLCLFGNQKSGSSPYFMRELSTRNIAIGSLSEQDVSTFVEKYVQKYFSADTICPGLLKRVGIQDLAFLHNLALLREDIDNWGGDVEGVKASGKKGLFHRIVQEKNLFVNPDSIYLDYLNLFIWFSGEFDDDRQKAIRRILCILVTSKEKLDLYEISTLGFDCAPDSEILSIMRDLSFMLNNIALLANGKRVYTLKPVWKNPLKRALSMNVELKNENGRLKEELIQRFRDNIYAFCNIENAYGRDLLDNQVTSSYFGNFDPMKPCFDDELILAYFVFSYYQKSLEQTVLSEPAFNGKADKYVVWLAKLFDEIVLNNQDDLLNNLNQGFLLEPLNIIAATIDKEDKIYYKTSNDLLKIVRSLVRSEEVDIQKLEQEIYAFCHEMANQYALENKYPQSGIRYIYQEALSLFQMIDMVVKTNLQNSKYAPLLRSLLQHFEDFAKNSAVNLKWASAVYEAHLISKGILPYNLDELKDSYTTLVKEYPKVNSFLEQLNVEPSSEDDNLKSVYLKMWANGMKAAIIFFGGFGMAYYVNKCIKEIEQIGVADYNLMLHVHRYALKYDLSDASEEVKKHEKNMISNYDEGLNPVTDNNAYNFSNFVLAVYDIWNMQQLENSGEMIVSDNWLNDILTKLQGYLDHKRAQGGAYVNDVPETVEGAKVCLQVLAGNYYGFNSIYEQAQKGNNLFAQSILKNVGGSDTLTFLQYQKLLQERGMISDSSIPSNFSLAEEMSKEEAATAANLYWTYTSISKQELQRCILCTNMMVSWKRLAKAKSVHADICWDQYDHYMKTGIQQAKKLAYEFSDNEFMEYLFLSMVMDNILIMEEREKWSDVRKLCDTGLQYIEEVSLLDSSDPNVQWYKRFFYIKKGKLKWRFLKSLLGHLFR